MGHILEILIDELHRGRPEHRAACANVVRFCQAKGNVGCSEAEWRTAAMLLHAKRMEHINHINQRKALIEKDLTPPEGSSSDPAAQAARRRHTVAPDRLKRLEVIEQRIKPPKPSSTNLTWRAEFFRQCYDMVEEFKHGNVAKQQDDSPVDDTQKAWDDLDLLLGR